MRIALVNPIARRAQGYHSGGSRLPQLGLQVLAELVPDGCEVDIIDEIFGAEGTQERLATGNYDLVGVTAYTSGATRAYEIAVACRELGIQTIMGGPHASSCPQEAGEYFDAVAVGECDEIWPDIVRDAEARSLSACYKGTLSNLADLGLGRANQRLQPLNGHYNRSAIQTSRGCPVGCEYCSVTMFNGAPIRRRRIPDIVKEWNSTPQKFIFVVDDNFFGVGASHAEWAKELLRTIIRHGKRRLWFSQTTLNMGADSEGLRLAYQAGCRGMLIGFESFNEQTLKSYSKGINRKNLSNYQELVDGFHRAGISVFGGFIIGSSEDTPNTVADTALSAVEMGVDIVQVTNLTPLPGTKMFDRFRDAGLLFAEDYPKDWERYSFAETIYNPNRMTARELDEAIYELRYAAAKTWWVWKRTLRTLVRTRSLTTALFVHLTNTGWKRMARIQAPLDAEHFGFTPRPSGGLTDVELALERRHGFIQFACPAFQARPGTAPGSVPCHQPPETPPRPRRLSGRT